MSSRKDESSPQKSPPHGRAGDACSMHVPATTEIRAAHPDRTEQSVTAEGAYRDWSLVPPADRPLMKHRAAHARVLFELLRDHKVSRSWFALHIGVNEKQVRKMINAEISIPSQVVACMPIEMRIDWLERLGAVDRPTIQDRIDRLDRAGLLDALTRITVALGAK